MSRNPENRLIKCSCLQSQAPAGILPRAGSCRRIQSAPILAFETYDLSWRQAAKRTGQHSFYPPLPSLYREPFGFARSFIAICPLAPKVSQILTLAGISHSLYFSLSQALELNFSVFPSMRSRQDVSSRMERSIMMPSVSGCAVIRPSKPKKWFSSMRSGI